MTIPASEIERLTKLLAMTTSDHDGEALVAIRKANELLARHKANWADVFQPQFSAANHKWYDDTSAVWEQEKARWAQTREDYERAKAAAAAVKEAEENDADIEEAFTRAFANCKRGSFRAFLNDLQRFWNENGYLTDRQKAALFKASM